MDHFRSQVLEIRCGCLLNAFLDTFEQAKVLHDRCSCKQLSSTEPLHPLFVFLLALISLCQDYTMDSNAVVDLFSILHTFGFDFLKTFILRFCTR